MNKLTMMASSSMSPLSRTAVPSVKPADPNAETTVAAEVGAATVLASTNAFGPAVTVEAAKSKKKKAADDDDKDKDDDDKDDDDDEESKALAAGNDDHGDRVHMSIDVARHARECERGRLLAILDSEAGKTAFAANPERILRFALTHPGTRLEAIAMLELFGGNLQPAKAPPLRERMESVRVEVGPGTENGGPTDERAALAAAILAAGRKAYGDKIV